MFCNQVNEIIGKDVNNLFGVQGLKLKDSTISYAGVKGIDCNRYGDTWPAGKVVLNRLLSVGIIFIYRVLKVLFEINICYHGLKDARR